MPVFFGTNRQENGVAGKVSFGGVRDSKVNYGIAAVTIPIRRHSAGSIERPLIPILERIERDFTIRGITRLDANGFFNLSRAQIGETQRINRGSERAALLFVHGFNVGFDDAVYRTAQISYDIKFKGATFLFSWPATSVYPYSKTAVDQSKRPIKEFITNIIDKAKPDRLYIVAHSMGTRGVSLALAELAQARPDLKSKIGALILASPDIDRQVFHDDVAPYLSRMTGSVTTYVSRTDKALFASKIANGDFALGDARGQIAVEPGMVTVDTSGIDTNFLGHSAYGDEPALLRDIAAIFAGRAVSARVWLRALTTQRGILYQINPAQLQRR